MCWELREREAEPGSNWHFLIKDQGSKIKAIIGHGSRIKAILNQGSRMRMTMMFLPGASVWRGGGGADATRELGGGRKRGGEGES